MPPRRGASQKTYTSRHGGEISKNSRLRWMALTLLGFPLALATSFGWTGTDIGATGAAGSQSISGSGGSVVGSGADIWGTADAFHFAYQQFTGDMTLVARVSDLTNTNSWAKAGLMIRESLAAGSRHAFVFTTPAANAGFSYRTTADGTSTFASGPYSWLPLWVKLVRSGDTFTAYQSEDGTTWDSVGSISLPMGATVYGGIAVTSHNAGTLCTATFDSLTVTGGGGVVWTGADIGSVTPVGSDSVDGTAATVSGAGADIWGAADAFHYAYRSWSGDGTFVVQVDSVGNTDPWAKAGIMVRETLAANSAHVMMLSTPAANSGLLYRSSTGGSSTYVGGSYSWLPLWLKLVRAGNTFTGYQSEDGTAWSLVGTVSVAMNTALYVGLAVTSHHDGTLCAADFTDLDFVAPTWSRTDIGIVSPPGSDTISGSAGTVSGAGADIWDVADACHFVYQRFDGDGTFVARVSAVDNTHAWAKAGIMVRDNLSSGSPQVMMATTPSNNSGLVYRSTSGGTSTYVGGAYSWLPLWLKVARSGNTFSCYQSEDGSSWALVGTVNVTLASNAYVGLAVTSHNDGTLCSATVDQISFTAGAGTPTVATPTFSPGGGTYSGSQTVTIASATSGASIFYSVDGSAPTTAYTGPIAVASSLTLKAKATLAGYNDSSVASAIYTIDSGPPTVATPTFTPAGGSYATGQTVTIASATSGASILYSDDGSAPSTPYNGPLSVASSVTLKAKATLSGYNDSAIATASYTIGSGSGGTPPPMNYAAADYIDLMPPAPGAETMHILTPTLLELVHISQITQPNTAPDSWDWAANNAYTGPSAGTFTITWSNGGSAHATQVGFRRHTLYAPNKSLDPSYPFNNNQSFDVRITNNLFLALDAAIPAGADVTVTFSADNQSWNFSANADPFRFNPALHVNQEGYMPGWQNKAFVAYYLGDMGELDPPTNTFTVVDQNNNTVTSGSLVQQHEVHDNNNPAWYNQKVYAASFDTTNLTLPGGWYRLKVDGMGVSLPFRIDSGIAMNMARTYALGLYHQRCGTALTLPYTRFEHTICHDAEVFIPHPESLFSGNFAPWDKIYAYTSLGNNNSGLAPQAAPALLHESDLANTFPFYQFGTVDVRGGHHDAGDYSRYTANSASLLHVLLFAADNLDGVGDLNNLGTPKVGAGKDLLREAKWEADFLENMQDQGDSGHGRNGFYYLVYPRYGQYEGGPPNNGVEQAVWPMQSGVTAGAIAALLQASTSPAFRAAYPVDAQRYHDKAIDAWNYLVARIAANGGDFGGVQADGKTRPSSVYQYIQHFGNEFGDLDDIAWALCELFISEHDPAYESQMMALYNPVQVLDQSTPHDFTKDTYNGSTMIFGYQHMTASYGNAARDYVFAVKSGRLAAGTQNPTYLQDLTDEVYMAAYDSILWSQHSAYNLIFPDAAKSPQAIGWYIAGSWAFDLAVGDALSQYNADGALSHQEALDALVSTMDYEAGGNPVNVAMVTGMGWKRQNVIVHQFSGSDYRLMPLSGIPVGTVRQGTVYSIYSLFEAAQRDVAYPKENQVSESQILSGAERVYAFYDRWADNWNPAAEMSTIDLGRGLGAYAYLAAMTPDATAQPNWTPASGTIVGPDNVSPGTEVSYSLQPPAGLTIDGTVRVVWETAHGIAGYGPTFTFTPGSNFVPGPNRPIPWIEAEATWPDGRRIFARKSNVSVVSFAAPTSVSAAMGSDVVLTLNRSLTVGALDVVIKTTSDLQSGEYSATSAHFDDGSPTATVHVHATANQRGVNPAYVRVNVDYWVQSGYYLHTDYETGSPGGATVTFTP